MKRTWFELGDVLRLLGLDRNTVDYWVRCSVVIPDKSADEKRRRFSLTNVIECAAARDLTANGLSVEQLRSVFRDLRERVGQLRPELQASATFVRYVEMIDAMVAINGPGPNYAAWRAEVNALVEQWRRTPVPLASWQVQKILTEPAANAGVDTTAQHG